jgi:hypothetical protein
MTKAFDLALFVPAPTSVGDGVVVSALGPPFATEFAPLVTGGQPGVTVGSSVPAATKGEQILVSGSSAGFPWSLIDNPAIAATVPPPTARFQVLWADATPAWVVTDLTTMLLNGDAVLNAHGAAFQSGANVMFAPTTLPSTRLDGSDPVRSILDNFSWDAGTF